MRPPWHGSRRAPAFGCRQRRRTESGAAAELPGTLCLHFAPVHIHCVLLQPQQWTSLTHETRASRPVGKEPCPNPTHFPTKSISVCILPPPGANPPYPMGLLTCRSPATKSAPVLRRFPKCCACFAKPCQFLLQAINCARAPLFRLVPLTVLPLTCVTPRLGSPLGPLACAPRTAVSSHTNRL